MAQLVAVCAQDAKMDTYAKDANYGASTALEIGPVYSGQNKDDLWRAIGNFDLTPIPAGAVLTAAKLQRWIQGLEGDPHAFAATIYRCTRPATWTENGCTWNKYDGSNAWTAAGGDWDATTPTPAGYTEDVTFGLKEVPGLLAFAQDAIVNRSGIVSIIIKADTESGAGTHHAVWRSREYATADERWRLIVDYNPANVGTPDPGRRGTLPGAGERRPRPPATPNAGRRPLTPSRGRNP